MKLNVERIEEDPRQQELGEWATRAAGEALEGQVQSLDGEIFVRRMDKAVIVDGQVQATVRRACDRCGAEVIAVIGGEMDLAYVPAEQGGNTSREVQGGDLDVGFFQDGAIDLADVLAEHFALCTPDRLACDLAAVSLAPGASCQADRIAKEPETKPVDPRFAALKGLKLD